MKINITETESYTLDMPDEIDAHQFFALLSRMQNVAKLFKNDMLMESATMSKTEHTPRGYTRRRTRRKYTREDILRLARVYYVSDKLQKDELAERENITPIALRSTVFKGVKKYNITPQEIGIAGFPTRGRQPTSREGRA